jgi:hypothetical protein
MTLTKNSTNYNVQDKIGDVNVNGNVSVNEDGSITINISSDNGGYASYTKNAEGNVNFNSSFNEANDLIDYMQGLVGAIRQELDF